MISTTLALFLAGAAVAAPLIPRASPPLSRAKAFNLIANVTDPSKDFFNPPVDHWYLTGHHAGGSISTTALDPTGGALFFVNGTGRDVSAGATSILMPPVPIVGSTPAPRALRFSNQPLSDNISGVEMDYSDGQVGWGIYPSQRSAEPLVFAPSRGKFMVCNETRQSYPAHPFPVRFALSHIVDEEGHEEADVPADCVEITFLAQCATLPELEGVDELNITVEEVSCYEDVASIDWAQY